MSQLNVESHPAPGMAVGMLDHQPVKHVFVTPLLKQLLVVFGSMLLLAILCWADVATGPHVHLGLLYVVPVLIATWLGGRSCGYVLMLSASVGWLYAGRPASDGTNILVTTANLLIRGFFYSLLVEMLSKVRDFGRQLERSVQERTIQLRQEITERLRAEESMRKLAGQLSMAEDMERRRIAYDIHDALSQMLGLAKMNLDTVVAETPTDSRQFERLTDVVKIMDDLIRQTREMTFDLHPSMLDHLGLVPTLERFAEEFQRRTLSEVSINESGDRRTIPSTLASYLFRSLKELANNAVKHGNAREIIIGIHWESDHLRCVVDDDGAGFDPDKALTPQVRRGLGLAGMDERISSLGGSMRVEPQPGNGARVILEVSVDKDSVLAQQSAIV